MSSLFSFPPIVAGTQAFFPVVTRSVLYDDITTPGNKRVLPGKKIIVNAHTGEGLSIVPEAQLAVPHMDAYNLGVHIFQVLFGCTPIVYKERTNSNQTDYSVDLVNEQCKFMLTENGVRIGLPLSQHEHRVLHEDAVENDYEINRPFPVLPEHRPTFYDEYYPFVRVSNYLRAQASFEIEVGYYRWKCSNGMMFGRRSQVSFRHSYLCPGFDFIAVKAENYFLQNGMAVIKYAQQMWKLLTIAIPKDQMHLIAIDIFKDELLKKRLNDRMNLILHLHGLCEKYAHEIGNNANAALNAATDLSKLLVKRRSNPSGVQELSGRWMQKFTRRNKDVTKYLESLYDLEYRIMTEEKLEIFDQVED